MLVSVSVNDVIEYKAVLEPFNLDIYSFLRYRETGIFKNLEPFRNDLKIYNSVEIPLPVVEPTNYREARIAINQLASENIKTYNRALEFDEQKNYGKAKALLAEILKQSPNDFDALSAQANVLANLKDYDDAFIHFEKALKICPNDVFVSRNYAIALLEAGKESDALQLADSLQKKFWYIDLHIFKPIKDFPSEIINKIMN